MPGLATPARCRPETIGDLRTLGVSCRHLRERPSASVSRPRAHCRTCPFAARPLPHPGATRPMRPARLLREADGSYAAPSSREHPLWSGDALKRLKRCNFTARFPDGTETRPFCLDSSQIRPIVPYRMSLEGTRAAKTLRIFGALGMGSFNNSKAFDGLPFS